MIASEFLSRRSGRCMDGNFTCMFIEKLLNRIEFLTLHHRVPLVSFVVFLLFLTIALVLASKKANPATYHEPLDWFRLFCEIVVFLIIGYDCFLEALDFWNN